MTLIRTSLLNGIAVIIKMLTLLSLNKILAVYVGPTGYAALGQFQNAIQMITTFASGAINVGVTKYTAEHFDNEAKQHEVWRTAGSIALTGSILTAFIVGGFNRHLAGWFLNDQSLGSVFIWFSSTLTLFVLNTLLLAILNGKKEIHRYVLANIAGSIFSLIITTVMAVKFGLYGALVALAIYQSLTFFVTSILIYKAPWFRVRYLFGNVSPEAAKNLAGYAAMALTSAACIPLSHIMIRNHLGETLGWEYAGYWEAMWRLSSAYLMLVTTTLAVYYLPRLSELKHASAIVDEIIQGYKIILPTAAACGLLIYLLRDFLIYTLFTADFAPMESLFAYQVLGDSLKIGSWLVAYVMLSKAMTSLFIVSEICSAFSFYGLTVLLTSKVGLEGAAIAHSLNYAIYWVVMFYFIRKNLMRRSPAEK